MVKHMRLPAICLDGTMYPVCLCNPHPWAWEGDREVASTKGQGIEGQSLGLGLGGAAVESTLDELPQGSLGMGVSA